ncbi:MAG: hypothetical protein DMG26_18695 [Acidobacteria bacterium]|nr:MAG: hypothetical protein DMG26_18695 [Acidobacteriota bacterium]
MQQRRLGDLAEGADALRTSATSAAPAAIKTRTDSSSEIQMRAGGRKLFPENMLFEALLACRNPQASQRTEWAREKQARYYDFLDVTEPKIW